MWLACSLILISTHSIFNICEVITCLTWLWSQRPYKNLNDILCTSMHVHVHALSFLYTCRCTSSSVAWDVPFCMVQIHVGVPDKTMGWDAFFKDLNHWFWTFFVFIASKSDYEEDRVPSRPGRVPRSERPREGRDKTADQGVCDGQVTGQTLISGQEEEGRRGSRRRRWQWNYYPDNTAWG